MIIEKLIVFLKILEELDLMNFGNIIILKVEIIVFLFLCSI